MASENTSSVYHPKDAIGEAVKTTMFFGGVGLFASAVQNTMQKRNVGPLGVITRTGGTIGLFAAVGGSYQFSKLASANLREKNDFWNSVIGGMFSGAVIGIRSRAMPAVVGYSFLVGSSLGTLDYCGGALAGFNTKDNNIDAFEELERIRTNYRTPIEQTMSEIGDRKGFPGYDERRRERVNEKYGIDLPAKQPPAS